MFQIKSYWQKIPALKSLGIFLLIFLKQDFYVSLLKLGLFPLTLASSHFSKCEESILQKEIKGIK